MQCSPAGETFRHIYNFNLMDNSSFIRPVSKTLKIVNQMASLIQASLPSDEFFLLQQPVVPDSKSVSFVSYTLYQV